jgi:DNA modification methylase
MGLKEKDLIGIPWMVAFALRADGWWLRRDIVWHKPNPMPESVDDRPTNSHEYIFLLSKSKDYYYDYTAILEPAAYDGRKDTRFKGSEKYKDSGQTFAERGHERWPKRLYPDGNNQLLHDYKHSGYFKDDGTPLFVMKDGIPMRNKRDVWTVNTAPYKEAHFATYPPALIKPCILAGTSERGECPKCGAPWERVTEKESFCDVPRGSVPSSFRANLEGPQQAGVSCKTITLGWQPTCTCNAGEPVPQTVLDPFSGAGTTGMVCQKLRRGYVGIDLSMDYLQMSRRRLMKTALADWGSRGAEAGGGFADLPMFSKEEE